MDPDGGLVLRAQLAVDEGAELVAHVGTHVKAFLSIARPRWSRLRTVPTGTPVTSAISAYGSPATSHSTTAVRNSSGRRRRASSTSSPSRPAASASSAPTAGGIV